jgi:hypothetical protein
MLIEPANERGKLNETFAPDRKGKREEVCMVAYEPSHMVVQLGRWEHDGSRKKSTKIHVEKQCTMQVESLEDPIELDLCAMLVHKGSLKQGLCENMENNGTGLMTTGSPN